MRATFPRISATVGAAAAAGLTVLLLAGCGGQGGGQAGGQETGSPSSPASSGPASAPASPGESPTSAPPRGRATDPATASRITLVKSGGFAGVHEQVVVETDGRWTYSTRDGKQQSGRLTGNQAAELRKLSGSTALADESRRKPGGPKCADAFNYALTVGDTVIRREHCGGSPPSPTFNAIVKLLADATPLN